MKGRARSMTSDQLQELILTALVRQNGGVRRTWKLAMGPLRLHAVETHPHCNWSVDPSGSARENAAIQRLLDDVRGQHPIIIG